MNFGRTIREMHRQVRREPGPERIGLREDELFAVLADSRRRFVIERLADERNDPPTCAGLAVAIAADETHMAPEQVPPRRVQPVEDDLRSEQLPRLADAGLLRWEGGAGAVRPGPDVEAVASLLDDVDRRIRRDPVVPSPPWGARGAVDAHEASGTNHP